MSSRPDVWTHNGVLVLTGDWLAVAAQAVKIAQRARRQNGLPVSRIYEQLGNELTKAMASSGHSDVRTPTVLRQLPHEQPTVTVEQAAERRGRSARQTRRLARQLGGRKLGGIWYLDEHAIAEHRDGRDDDGRG